MGRRVASIAAALVIGGALAGCGAVAKSSPVAGAACFPSGGTDISVYNGMTVHVASEVASKSGVSLVQVATDGACAHHATGELDKFAEVVVVNGLIAEARRYPDQVHPYPPTLPPGQITMCGLVDYITLPGQSSRSMSGCSGIAGFAHPWQATTAQLHVGDVVHLYRFLTRPWVTDPKVARVALDGPASQRENVNGALTATAPGTTTLYVGWPSCMNGNAGKCAVMNFHVTR